MPPTKFPQPRWNPDTQRFEMPRMGFNRFSGDPELRDTTGRQPILQPKKYTPPPVSKIVEKFNKEAPPPWTLGDFMAAEAIKRRNEQFGTPAAADQHAAAHQAQMARQPPLETEKQDMPPQIPQNQWGQQGWWAGTTPEVAMRQQRIAEGTPGWAQDIQSQLAEGYGGLRAQRIAQVPYDIQQARLGAIIPLFQQLLGRLA